MRKASLSLGRTREFVFQQSAYDDFARQNGRSKQESERSHRDYLARSVRKALAETNRQKSIEISSAEIAKFDHIAPIRVIKTGAIGVLYDITRLKSRNGRQDFLFKHPTSSHAADFDFNFVEKNLKTAR